MTSRGKGEREGGFSRKGAAFSRLPKPPPLGGWSIHSNTSARIRDSAVSKWIQPRLLHPTPSIIVFLAVCRVRSP